METGAIVYHATAQPLGRRRWKHSNIPGWWIHRGSSGDTGEHDGSVPSLCGHANANAGIADPDTYTGNADANTWNAYANRYGDSHSDCHGYGHGNPIAYTGWMSDDDHAVEQPDDHDWQLGLVQWRFTGLLPR